MAVKTWPACADSAHVLVPCGDLRCALIPVSRAQEDGRGCKMTTRIVREDKNGLCTLTLNRPDKVCDWCFWHSRYALTPLTS